MLYNGENHRTRPLTRLTYSYCELQWQRCYFYHNLISLSGVFRSSSPMIQLEQLEHSVQRIVVFWYTLRKVSDILSACELRSPGTAFRSLNKNTQIRSSECSNCSR